MTGRSIQNAGDITSYLFKNFALNSGSLAGVNAELWPGYLDKNGYPTQNPTNNIGFSVVVSPTYTGRWVIKFSGVGEIQFLAASTTVFDQDSCVVAAGGNTKIRSNTASETRGVTRVVVQFTTHPSSFSANFPSGSAKFSNVGGVAPNQLSSMQGLVFCRCSAPYGNGGATASGDESDIDSGDISRMFNDDSLAILSALKPLALRFMGFLSANSSNVARHDTRNPLAALTYMSRRWDPKLWAGSATGSDGIYSCSAAPSTPGTHTDGEQVQVQFASAQQAAHAISGATLTGGTTISLVVADTSNLTTGQKAFIDCPGFTDTATGTSKLDAVYSITVVDGTHVSITGTFSGAYTSGGNIGLQPTLNVGARGAKPILTNQGVAPNSFFGTPAIAALMFSTLTYDALLGAWIHGNINGVTVGGLGGDVGTNPPVEVCVALCNKLGVGIWWNFPATIISSEAILQAAVIRDNLTAGLLAFFEYGNENWNNTFTQNHLLFTRGQAYGIPLASSRALFSYWGQRFCEIMSGIGAIWSGGAILKRTLAFQGAGDTTVNSYLLTGSLLNSSTAGYWNINPVDWSVNGSRPLDFAEYFSYGVYYYGSQAFQFDAEYIKVTAPVRDATYYAGLTAAADAFAAGDASQASFIDSDVRVGTALPSAVTIAADGTFTLSSGTCTSNGIFSNTLLQLFVSGGVLPAPLVATNKIYYAVSVGASTFKVSLASGGSAITSLTGGSGTFTVGLTGQNMLFWNSDRRDFWNAYAVTYNKGIVLYEAAEAAWFPSTASCTTMGISTAYSQKILDLVIAYKKSNYLQQNVMDQMNGFIAASKSVAPCQLQLVGENAWSMLQGFIPPVSGTSSSFNGDINGAIHGSFDAVRLYNNNNSRLVVKA